MVLLPVADDTAAQVVASRLPKAVQKLAMPSAAESKHPSVTVSIRASTGLGNDSVESMLAAGATALYRAKAERLKPSFGRVALR